MLIAVFLVLTMICFAVLAGTGQAKSETETLNDRLALITAPLRVQTPGELSALVPGRWKRYSLAGFEARVLRSFAGEKLKTLLLQSGSTLSPSRVFLWSACFAAATAIIAALIMRSWLPAAIAITGAGALPTAALHMLRKRRVARFEAALPDAIDLMARSLRAGHSTAAAMEIVAERCVEPLAGEFAQVTQQQRLGVMFRTSILGLAARVPSQDLHFLATAMLVQRESGGDLTAILDGTRKVIADRLRINGQVRTHSAQGRFTGWILSVLPFVLLLLINTLNPGYTRVLFTDPVGKRLLFGGIASISVGIAIIRKIVNVKV